MPVLGAGAGCCELAAGGGNRVPVCWVLLLAVRVVETGCLESWRTAGQLTFGANMVAQCCACSHSKAVDVDVDVVVDGALCEHPYALVPEDDVMLKFDTVLFWKRLSKVEGMPLSSSAT